jgi:hypothetical protein
LEKKSERLQLAGRVRSPTAASEHSNSQNLDLADWPLSGNRYGRFGHAALSGVFKFEAGLQPLNFGAW